MSKYTTSIFNMLSARQQAGEDITDFTKPVPDILAVSQRSLFDKAPMSVINADWRDPFMIGFAMHYLWDEIGLETIPAWKMALAEKIFNNAQYINLIYEQLPNNLTAELRQSNRQLEGDRQNETVTEFASHSNNEQTTTNDLTRKNTGTQENTETRDLTQSESGSDQFQSNGSNIKSFQDYKDKLTKSGSNTNVRSGSETSTEGYTNYKETETFNTQDVLSKSGTETSTDHYTDYTVAKDNTESHAGQIDKQSWHGESSDVKTPNDPQGNRTKTETHKGGMLHHETDHATDNTSAVSNTPQNGINASEIMGTSVTGTSPGVGSVVTPNENGKKYLSGAQHNWTNDRAHESWDIPYDQQNGDVRTITETDTMGEKSVKTQTQANASHEITDDSGHSTTNSGTEVTNGTISHETTFDNRQDTAAKTGTVEKSFAGTKDGTKTYNNVTDQETLDTSEERTVEGTETDTQNKTDTTTYGKHIDNGGTIGHNRVDDLTEKQTGTVGVVGENSTGSDTNMTTQGTVKDTEAITASVIDYKTIREAEPFLNKVWELFDDIFMQLI